MYYSNASGFFVTQALKKTYVFLFQDSVVFDIAINF